MKKLLTLLFLSFGLVTFGQVYQLMPQYGYQANRFRFDSTLQIPTVCGVPTLKSNVTKLGAIAFDSCNNRFYTYNPKTAVWSQVSGGGGSTDTSSLSARINLKIDSVKRRSDSVFAYRNGTEVFQFRDSIRPIDTPTTVIMTVYNASGSTLLKGEVVFLFGANGDRASVRRANNKHDSTSSKTIGIVRRDIASGGIGTVTTQGQVEKLDLDDYAPGDILWLDSISGKFTASKPQAPNHAVFLGVVERANQGNGLIYVKPQNGVEMDEIHDVLVQTPLNNQTLVYSDTLGVWKNRSVYTIVDTTKLSARIDARIKYTDSSTMLTPYLRKSDTASLSTRIVNSALSMTQLYRRLGSATKAIVPMNGSIDMMSANFTMTDGNQWFYTFYLDRNDTLKGVRFFMRTQGSYTAEHYNGIALYTMSGGTLTLVDSSANDGNIWKATANSWGSKDFVFPYPATEGFYVISFISNWTTTPAATPIIGGITTLINGNARGGDFSNGYSLGYNTAQRTSLHTSVVASTLTYIAPAPILLIY
jgi:hypothetical protein